MSFKRLFWWTCQGSKTDSFFLNISHGSRIMKWQSICLFICLWIEIRQIEISLFLNRIYSCIIMLKKLNVLFGCLDFNTTTLVYNPSLFLDHQDIWPPLAGNKQVVCPQPPNGALKLIYCMSTKIKHSRCCHLLVRSGNDSFALRRETRLSVEAVK